MHAGGNETGDVGHVDHQVGADRIGDLTHALEVDEAGVGAGAGDDQLRTDLLCLFGNGVIVDPLGLTADAVGLGMVILAGNRGL